jgi:Kef-type K+ transport system membrane component KefB
MLSLFPLASSGGLDPLVQDIGVCLVSAGVITVIFERLKIPAIAALLAAGVLVGPIGLTLVTDQRNINTIAQLGLALLLFLIGLEVNLKSLLASGRTLVLGGLLQVPLSIAAAFGIFEALRAAGWTALEGRYVTLYFAFACAFSSTLLVVKLLQERLRLDTIVGRLSVGLLIFQDVWAIVVLAVQPNFSNPELGGIAATLGGIGIVALVAAVMSRYVLPVAFRLVAGVPELIVSAALAWCFGLGLFGANLGRLLEVAGLHVEVSVSLEMGALIAGTSIATFPYAFEVVSKVGNLRDFFITLFFVALGMGIPVPQTTAVIALAAALCLVTIALRFLVFIPLLYHTGLDRKNAVETSVILAQVSEFCLVIAFLGVQFKHIDEAQASVVIFAFVITALLTPWLFDRSERLPEKLGPLLTRLGIKPPPERTKEEKEKAAHRLVILGFHRIASALLHDIERFHPELIPQMVVIDTNVGIHNRIRETGVEVKYGDISNRETLKHAGVDGAEVIVSTVPDDLLRGTSNVALTRTLRALNPTAMIIVNAVRTSDVPKLYEAGATYTFMWPIESSRGVLPAIYAAFNGNLEEFLAARRLEYGRLSERKEVLE